MSERPLVLGTPLENHLDRYGLHVKREDLSSPDPGPHFSKMRGVLAHLAARPEHIIGVLDTYHSQAGWAVAWACKLLGKECINFYPVYKADDPLTLRTPQRKAGELGAFLDGIPAGRSAILFHQAKKRLAVFAQKRRRGSIPYMMPNALKLAESVEETAQEVARTFKPRSIMEENSPGVFIVPSSSATICAGVARGLYAAGFRKARVICHLGYSRSHEEVRRYVAQMMGTGGTRAGGSWLHIIDEGYAYKDKAKAGEMPPWPCNEYYDLKAFRWWLAEGRERYGTAVLWNIG